MPNTPTKRTQKTNPSTKSNSTNKSSAASPVSRGTSGGAKGNGASKSSGMSRTSVGSRGNSNAENGNGMKSKTGSSQSLGRKNKLSADSNSQLEKFFHDQVKDLYWAEKHLTKALPKMQKAATTEELRSAIQEHTGQTQEHVARLEQVFQLLGKKAQAKKCDAMEGLVKEGETAVEETQKGSMTRDVAIIMASQKVEHYEIASYGTLVQLAETMGNTEIAEILQTTLEEEKQTDQNLTFLAENNINWEAESEEEEDELMEEDEEDEEDQEEDEEDEE